MSIISACLLNAAQILSCLNYILKIMFEYIQDDAIKTYMMNLISESKNSFKSCNSISLMCIHLIKTKTWLLWCVLLTAISCKCNHPTIINIEISVNNWMAWCNTSVSDFFGWIFFPLQSAWIFSCHFQLSSKTLPDIFFGWFTFYFWEKKNSKIYIMVFACSASLRSLCMLRYFLLVFLGPGIYLKSAFNQGPAFISEVKFSVIFQIDLLSPNLRDQGHFVNVELFFPSYRPGKLSLSLTNTNMLYFILLYSFHAYYVKPHISFWTPHKIIKIS